MARTADRFAPLAERHEGGFRHFATATCACGHVGRVPYASRSPLPPQVITKKLKELGWTVGANASRDRCPNCSKPAPRIPTPKTEVIAMATQADPPKKPTAAERSRIIEEIEARWNRARSCYAQAWTDQSVAATLNVPRAWVSECRVFAFGEEDRNEQQEQLVTEVAELMTMLATAQSGLMKAMETVDEVERRLKKAETSLAYAKVAA